MSQNVLTSYIDNEQYLISSLHIIFKILDKGGGNQSCLKQTKNELI